VRQQQAKFGSFGARVPAHGARLSHQISENRAGKSRFSAAC
jgi:hypothetical protein